MALIFPDLFRPYVEGREAAIAANWADRDKFNKVREGELDNIFKGASMDARLQQQEGLANELTTENLFKTRTMDSRVEQETARLAGMNIQNRGGELGNIEKELEQPFVRPRAEANVRATEAGAYATRATGEQVVALTDPTAKLVTAQAEREEIAAKLSNELFSVEVANRVLQMGITEQQLNDITLDVKNKDATQLERIAATKAEFASKGLSYESLQLDNALKRNRNPIIVKQEEAELSRMQRENRFGDASYGDRLRKFSAETGLSEAKLELAIIDKNIAEATSEDQIAILKAQRVKAEAVNTFDEANNALLLAGRQLANADAQIDLDLKKLLDSQGIRADDARALLAINQANAKRLTARAAYAEEQAALDMHLDKMNFWQELDKPENEAVLDEIIKNNMSSFQRWWNNDLSKIENVRLVLKGGAADMTPGANSLSLSNIAIPTASQVNTGQSNSGIRGLVTNPPVTNNSPGSPEAAFTSDPDLARRIKENNSTNLFPTTFLPTR